MPAMNTPFRYLPVASPLHDDRARAALVAAWQPLLEAAGGTPANGDDLDGPAPLAYLILTGGTEQEVLRLRSLRARSHPEEPVLLLAHPLHNSLPAALEILARLQQDRQVGRILFLDDTAGESVSADLREAVRCVAAAAFLRRARIGVIGRPSDWLVASTPAPATVQARWGPTLVDIPLERVREGLTAEGADRDGPLLEGAPRDVTGPTPADLNRSASICQALRALADEWALDALTIRCFDLVVQDRATGCLALARLNDDGLPAGCEGDIPSVLGLLWTAYLTGQPGWMANPARVDAAAGRLLLAHCTVPVSLVTGYALRTHFESGLGAAIQGDFAPGEVTLLRIGGRELDQLWLGEGVIEASTRPGSAACWRAPWATTSCYCPDAGAVSWRRPGP
jgi:L-fucose isomerase-like protein